MAKKTRTRYRPVDLNRDHARPRTAPAPTCEALLPTLLARAAARRRPQPPAIQRALGHFSALWVADASTLEAVFRKVGAVRGRTETIFGGKLLAVLDLPSKLPVHLWWDEDAA